VDYINGTGIRLLAAAAADLRTADTELVICGLQPVVQTSPDIAGPIAHLTIEQSVDAAMSRLIQAGQGPT
jgi:anti-anti-sigma regulatory factor